MIVISAATSEAIEEIRRGIDIFDSAESIDQGGVFVYKVSHNKAAQLAQALAVITIRRAPSLTIDTSTGNSRTDTLNSTSTSRSSSQNQNQNQNRTTNTTGTTIGSRTKTDQSSSLFDTRSGCSPTAC
jgi:hypothetical protein